MEPQTQPKRILVIAAHPDDEVLGCGGTMALHARQGDEVTVVIAAEGRPAGPDGTRAAQRSFTEPALARLGVRDARFLGFPDQKLDTFPLTALIDPLLQVVRTLRPQIVYCQYGGDVNQDHTAVFRAALVATRPTEPSIEAVYAFDTASSTEWAYPRTFVPDTWVDISSTLELKLAAMACYESEVQEYPLPRSLEALRHRAQAYGHQCCLEAAEVFMTVRRVKRGGMPPL